MPKKKTNKETKISVNKIDRILNTCPTLASKVLIDTYDPTTGEKLEPVEIIVKESISFGDYCAFVQDVVDNVFIDSTYMPYVRDIAICRAILTYFTNVKSEINIDKLYSLSINQYFMDSIKNEINQEQYISLINSIDEMIEFKKQEMLANKPNPLDGLFNSLQELLDKIKGSFDGKIDVDKLMGFVGTLASMDRNEFENKVINIAKEENAEVIADIIPNETIEDN
jgi:hypothetical protein